LNEYGSISGSFRIPKTAATGEWSIDPDYVETGSRNDGSFRVEEYRRPTYEITLDKPKKELLPGDSFTVKVKVRSFAGAALNNVRINFSVGRSGTLPYYDSLLGKTSGKYEKVNIVDTFAYTDPNGELTIAVDDSALRQYQPGGEGDRFEYRLHSEAIDMTGESYEAESSIEVLSQPTRINLGLASSCNRNDNNSVVISTYDNNAGRASKVISVKIFRVIKKDETPHSDRELTVVDQWMYSKDQLQQWFPLIDFTTTDDTGTRKLVLEKTINTGNGENLKLDSSVFAAGNYVLEATCRENGRLKGHSMKNFMVFDEKENALPQRSWSFYHLPYNAVSRGKMISYTYGNSESPFYSIFCVKYFAANKKVSINQYLETGQQERGLHRWNWTLPADATDQAIVTQLYIINNQLFTHSETIFISGKETVDPEIIVEQYRQKLTPGGKETFSVSIQTKNEKKAAELMTTLYDASLDKLEEHRWRLPFDGRRNRYLRDIRPGYFNSDVTNIDYLYYDRDETTRATLPTTAPLWWLSSRDRFRGDTLAYQPNEYLSLDRGSGFGLSGSLGYNFEMNREQLLMGRVSGVQVTNAQGLDEVVVVGYGAMRRSSLTASMSSIVRIRGAGSLSDYKLPLVILDGVPFTGDLSKIDPNSITNGIILKGADAAAIYGARASEGVLVLSTKGEIIFPTAAPEPLPPPRKNFNETAFFFPAIYADKNGYFKFTFTMPESVTEWNWKMFAHTKSAQFIYKEKKLNTQLPLMVQPNMPRLLYQGDRIVLQSRISNLDTAMASGKISCRVEDVVTGEDLTSQFVSKTTGDFSIAKKANISSAFELRVPREQLNPVKLIISVRSQNFADGEEHIIPILSPKILVKGNVPFRFAKNADTVIQPMTIPAGSDVYGVGLSILPKPQSALINALPYLAHYSIDCAEQTFNKLRAWLTAFKIMKTDQEAQASFEKAKQAVEKQPEDKEQLPEELSEQAMPWLNLANQTAKQQRQLFELLDTSQALVQMRNHMDRLFKLQNSDGGLTWFDGGDSDPYISDYVLAGFGKLNKDGLSAVKKIFDERYTPFIERLARYCERQAHDARYQMGLFEDPVFNAYAESYWGNQYPLRDSSRQRILGMLRKKWQQADDFSLYRQALLITTTLRYFDQEADEYKMAIKQLNSIAELAIKDDLNGIRWKDIADNDDMSYSAEETMAFLTKHLLRVVAAQKFHPAF
jgi:hypothetical protein